MHNDPMWRPVAAEPENTHSIRKGKENCTEPQDNGSLIGLNKPQVQEKLKISPSTRILQQKEHIPHLQAMF